MSDKKKDELDNESTHLRQETDEHIDPQDAGEFTHLGQGEHLKSDEGETGFGLGYTKVSAEELRDQMRRRREVHNQQRREAAAKRSPVFSVARMAVTAVAILGAVGSVMYVAGTAGDFDKKSQVNSEKINALKAELDTVNNSSKKSIDGAQLVNSIDQAKVAAKAIADIQNDMANTRVFSDMPPEQVQVNNDKYVASVNEAKKYISKNAQSTGTFEPQQRWISPVREVEIPRDAAEAEREGLKDVRLKRTTMLPSSEFTWIAHGTYSVDPQTNQVPVVWSCVTTGAEGGKLMAWATADFDPSTGLFSNFRKSVTPFGQRMTEYGTPSVENGEQRQNEEDVSRLEKMLQQDVQTQKNKDEEQAKTARRGGSGTESAKPSTSVIPSGGASAPSSAPRTSSPDAANTEEGR